VLLRTAATFVARLGGAVLLGWAAGSNTLPIAVIRISCAGVLCPIDRSWCHSQSCHPPFAIPQSSIRSLHARSTRAGGFGEFSIRQPAQFLTFSSAVLTNCNAPAGA